jgi:hypothetical protein
MATFGPVGAGGVVGLLHRPDCVQVGHNQQPKPTESQRL